MKTRTYIEIGMVLLIAVLLILLEKSCNKISDQQDFLFGMNNTLETFRNKNGEQEAKINILKLSSKKAFLKIKSKDSTIIWLQNTVDEYKGKLESAMVASTTTNSEGATETLVIHDTDIVYINDTAYVYPVYSAEWNTKWETGLIKASKDSIYYDIKIKNEFEITYGEVKNGWLKKKEQEVKIKNLNPNTETVELRIVNFVQTPKNFNIGIQVGYGIGVTDLKFQPYIGVGISYRLLGVK